MEAKVRHQEDIPEEVAAAANAILGANPFVGIDARQLLGTYGTFLRELFRHPEALGDRLASLVSELVRIAVGVSEVAPDSGDKRFADPAWSDNPAYHRLMQTYLAWRSAMQELIPPADARDGNWKEADQQRFAIRLLTEALAPTNTLAGNPAALKRAFETGGMSLLRGARNFLYDLWNNGGMPQQVDKRPFTVGRTIAVTPGAVVYRSELIELLQYSPTTRQVYERPVLLVPPQINKFYIMDLAPKRSFTEYAVAHGVPFFTVSWRNPKPEHHDWGIDQYVGACKDALSVVCEISGSRDANLVAVCAGGITSTLMLAHLAALGEPRVHAATLIVTMLDSTEPSMTAMFATEEAVEAALARSRRKGVLDAGELARTFAWLRPNDLVWNYWVNNYLMGSDPAPYDVLFWNADSTNLPAALHAGFLDLLLHNHLMHPGAMTVLGTPVDLRKIGCDMFAVGGMTDHICSWRAVHHGARQFGGRVEFVLNSSGHVQTLVCPPDNFKARYYLNPQLETDAEKWLKGAREHKGTWWDHWLEWIDLRSGDKREAPATLGSARFQPLGPAPGRYVTEA
ncbi:MAG TPA: alpha/beta fold hydrolase [Candidatus Binataceae bacterium]|nr:alpha/beta fold hydrolase [Candidatus Binataceae bacterium]